VSPLVDIEDLSVTFGSGRAAVPAVRGVSFRIEPGECVAMVGESGSGKTVTARTLVGLTGRTARISATRADFDGRSILDLRERDWRSVRGVSAGLVLQDALVSLDPMRRIGREVAEPLLRHRTVPRHRVADRVLELLTDVGIPDPEQRAGQYPHQLSGGLRQRALIASALACGPRLIIADEPTTALDVTVQAQILALLHDYRAAGTALLLVSHDLAVVAGLADRILVLRDGRIVERGTPAEVLGSPGHEYTRALIDAVPRRTPRRPREVSGEPVLTATGLRRTFRHPDGPPTVAVDDVSFTLRAGETVGVVGESGSGKSTLARLVLGLDRPDAGQVRLDGRDWSGVTEKERRTLRSAIQFIPQDPLSSFDPRHTVRRILTDALAAATTAADAPTHDVPGLLGLVGLSGALAARRPASLSGGQRQRVAIARALAVHPRVIVCDEPVSAVDVRLQAEVLRLLIDLRDRLQVAYLFISHDLAVIEQISDHVLVMRRGKVVESGPTAQIMRTPRHQYTQTLLSSIPRLPTFTPASP
jgi:peptide/nickel transport system ATP-binding protein